MVDETLLNSEDAALYLGITPNYLRQLQFRKKIQWATRHGSRVYYSLIILDTYAASQKTKTPSNDR